MSREEKASGERGINDLSHAELVALAVNLRGRVIELERELWRLRRDLGLDKPQPPRRPREQGKLL